MPVSVTGKASHRVEEEEEEEKKVLYSRSHPRSQVTRQHPAEAAFLEFEPGRES